jgi:myo-inositol-1(or 4)-monophosphatase
MYKLDSREILASNGLIHAELLGLFSDMFAGRALTPILTPREFAQSRAARAAAE